VRRAASPDLRGDPAAPDEPDRDGQVGDRDHRQLRLEGQPLRHQQVLQPHDGDHRPKPDHRQGPAQHAAVGSGQGVELDDGRHHQGRADEAQDVVRPAQYHARRALARAEGDVHRDERRHADGVDRSACQDGPGGHMAA
jgi:hypothetical protein